MSDNNNELSEREIEILTLVASGKSNKDIGQILFISPNTVKVHLRNIFGKLEVASRTEATLHAIRMGLVNTEMTPVTNGNGDEVEDAQELLLTSSDDQIPAQMKEAAVKKWWQTPFGIAGLSAGVLILILVSGFTMSRWMPLPQATPTQAISLNADQSRWKQLESLPVPRAGLSAAVYEGHIYVFGGQTAQGVTDTAERYKPESNSWISLPSKPTAVTNIQAVLLGGKIYIPGGELASGQITNVLEIYDPKENMWMNGPSLPMPLSAYALVAFEGKLYLFGGWNGTSYSDTVLAFDPDRNEWQEKSSLPSPRAFAGAMAAIDKIFVVGGYDGQKALDSNLGYLPDRDQNGNSPWETWPSLPTGRYAMGTANIANAIYLIGGIQDNQLPAVHLILTTGSNEWVQPASEFVTLPWSNIATAIVGANLYAMGGILDGELTGLNISFQAIYTVPLPVIIK